MEKTVTTKRKTLMTLSWEIQKKKHSTRSEALQSAWGITQNNDIVVYYLVKKHSVQRPLTKPVHPTNLTIGSRY